MGYVISLIALVFSVTNFIYVSVVPLLLLPIAFFILFAKKFVLPKHIAAFLLLIFYIIISNVFYDASSFLDFSFYRRDGNFFITYLLFFTVFMLGCYKDPRTDLKKSFLIIAIASVFGFLFGHNKGGLVHFFLFEAHNAAGGFYGVMTALTLGFFLSNKSKLYLIYSIFFGFCLLMSDSRGTLLAFIFTSLYFLLFRFKKPIFVFSGLIVVQVLILMWSYPIWLKSGSFISDEATFDSSVSLNNVERGGTIIDRVMYLWPRAFDNFLHSPIFGTGFGSYDDLGYHYLKIVPFFSIKYGQNIRHTDAHAHNSFLTILAELGVVGFFLFFLFFYYIYKEVEKVEFWAKDLSLALKFAFWVCIFSSATEHRLTTPSQMIPFLIILALALAYNRHLNLRSRVY